jgi:hypothetical protein
MEFLLSEQLSQLEWGDLATWFSGIVTFLALLLTFINIVHNNNKERERKESEQASQISAWIEDLDGIDLMKVVIKNSSSNPIYDTIISVHSTSENISTSEATIREYIRLIRPGISHINTEPFGGGMHTRAFLEIGFRDCHGNSWIKSDDGTFKKIDVSLQNHYNLTEPLNWRTPDQQS